MHSVSGFVTFEGAHGPVTVNLAHICSVAPYRGDKDQTLIVLAPHHSTWLLVCHPYEDVVRVLDAVVGVADASRQEATA
jgi:hypothetical protein